MGKPQWQPTDEQRAQVEALSSYGVPQAEIARYMNVALGTLRKHCKGELENASTRANARVAESLFEQAISGKNTAATIFWMKSRARWRETERIEHGGRDGGPLTIQVIYGDDNGEPDR